MSASRHSTPLVVTADGEVVALSRFELGDERDALRRREEFLQTLVHDHPTLIPMLEIEPAFTPLVSICRELPTATGSVDNLWMTPDGGLVIGECKRVRNNQARREVLVQALDYARELHAMDFDALQAAVRRARRDATFSLWSHVRLASAEGECPDEPAFIDAVERRLRSGRFVVLLVLDGVQEALESLVGYLQLHAGLHATVAIVELSLWKRGEETVVVPRIPLRTLLVERGIVVVPEGHGISIAPVRTATTSAAAAAGQRQYTLSEEEFLAQVIARFAGDGEAFRRFLQGLEEVGVTPEYGRSVVLRFMVGPSQACSAGYIDTRGAVWLGDAIGSARRLGIAPAGERYLERVASAIGAHVHRYENPNTMPQLRTANERAVLITDLMPRADEWRAAIAEFVEHVAAHGASQAD